MKEFHFKGPGPVRLDRFIQSSCPEISLGRLHKYWRQNKVKLNGKRLPLNTRLAAGDTVRLYLPAGAADTPDTAAGTHKLTVLLEDENLLAVYKPAGLLCQEEGAATGKDTLLARVRHYLAEKESAPSGETSGRPLPSTGHGLPALCHRLDTGTSGVVLAAKTPEMLEFAQALIREQKLEKRYVCVCYGKPAPAQGELEGWLFKDAKKGMVSVEPKKTPGSKMARLRYKTLRVSGRFSLLEIELITGRTHQIRAQLCAAGYPVLGDSKYGNAALNREMKCRYQCLCAVRVRFPALEEGRYRAYSGLAIECAMPWYYEQVLDGTLR